MAERLATRLGASVLLIDRRPHLGGNTHDAVWRDGIRHHAYGPHIFHTNSERVVEYLSQFTQWRPYEHKVLSRVRGQLVPIPINRSTINRLYGRSLDSSGVAAFLAERAEAFARIDNSELLIRSRVGRELYELFFRGYTRKQWGRDPAELDATVCGRIPVRIDDDDRYFSDRFQAMPVRGFTEMVRRMVARDGIDIELGLTYREAIDAVRARHVIFTGPIDEYFGFRYGKLPYRSLRFEFETHAQQRYQAAACINEPDECVPFTRTTEYAYLTEPAERTVVSREYPSASGDPYYPIPCAESRALYARYARLAALQPNVTFAGRLAEYRYYNMDQVVASALMKVDQIVRDAVA